MTDAPKVTMLQTPSEKIINRSKELNLSFVDTHGRKIELEIPDVLDHYDFNKALGKDAEFPSCVAMAAPLMYIKSLNGEPFKKPQVYSEIRAGLKRLGIDGVKEVGKFLMESGVLDDLTDEEKLKEELKK